MIVVIDTNCLLASISPLSSHYWLFNAFKTNNFQWLISTEVMMEYEERLTSKYSSKTANLVLSIISVSTNVIFKEPYFNWNLISADPDDNKFADLAISGNADYIITNDKHFSPLKVIEFPRLNILNINEFKILLNY